MKLITDFPEKYTVILPGKQETCTITIEKTILGLPLNILNTVKQNWVWGKVAFGLGK